MSTWSLPTPPSRLQGNLHPSTPFLPHDPWNTRAEVLEGRFCFLNEQAHLGRPVDWSAPEQSLLWQFNLHYFHYLPLLEPDEQSALCREWVAENPGGSGAGWHPYPTSLRIVNWCKAELTAPDLLESLYLQAAHLSRNIETHVYGNHLLENARALVMAGCYLQGQGEAPHWRKRGLDLYQNELDEQVLSDGLHYERSPLYHALMLEGCLDVLNVLPDDHAARGTLRTAARAMTDALAAVTHPDGTLALFNDTTHEIAPSTEQLLRYSHNVLDTPRTASQSAFPEAGYYVLDTDDVWIMIDGGPAGPEHLMAHAHADLFSYELSLFGERIIVDSGVYEYAAGPMRQSVRGTAAHNTVQVDGLDQIECWDSFRVARREAPRSVVWEETETGAVFEGTFDGYQARLGDDLSHRRRLDVDTDARRIEVHDEITGRGRHSVKSRVHIHPETAVRRDGEGIHMTRGEESCQIEVTEGQVQWEEGWYCPRFGVRHRTRVLTVENEGQLPLRCGYHLRY